MAFVARKLVVSQFMRQHKIHTNLVKYSPKKIISGWFESVRTNDFLRARTYHSFKRTAPVRSVESSEVNGTGFVFQGNVNTWKCNLGNGLFVGWVQIVRRSTNHFFTIWARAHRWHPRWAKLHSTAPGFQTDFPCFWYKRWMRKLDRIQKAIAGAKIFDDVEMSNRKRRCVVLNWSYLPETKKVWYKFATTHVCYKHNPDQMNLNDFQETKKFRKEQAKPVPKFQ